MREDLREFLNKLRWLFRRRRVESEMAEELEFHLAMRCARHTDGGLESGEAFDQARREFGAVGKWKEFCRDVWQFRFVENLWRDLLFAARMLRKSPAFAAVAVLTLALAIGANTAIFSLINAVLLRPLAVPRADRLVLLRIQPDDFGYSFCYPMFRHLEKDRKVFAKVFAFAGHRFQMRGASGTEYIPGSMVSGDYFDALQVAPATGRWITPADDREGGGPDGPVAIISTKLWKTWFAASPGAIGRKIVLDNVAFTVAGVMPDGFTGADVGGAPPDVFVPLALEPLIDAPYNNIANGWRSWWFLVGARLRDGVSQEQANAYLRATSQDVFKATIPDPRWRLNGRPRSQIYLKAESGAAGYCSLRLRFRKPLVVLMVLVGLVLLVACLNVASLLMARSAAREREIVTRFALGASRVRLLQQFLTESLLLATLGTALGLAGSPLIARSLMGFLSTSQDQVQFAAAPDGRVLLFTAVIAVLATVFAGIAPGLKSTRHDLQSRLREASAGLRGTDRRRVWPRLLLSGEVALALVLVTGAGLLGSSLVRLREIPVGFEPRGLLLVPIDVFKQSRDGDALVRLYRELAESISGVPGVQAISFADTTPVSGSWTTDDVNPPGRPQQELYRAVVGPDYFRAMRTRLVAGREFRWNDTDASGAVVILNRAAAKALFGTENAVGERLLSDKRQLEVIGIVGDAKYTGLRDAAPPTWYAAATQGVKNKPSFTAVIRLNGPAAPVISAIRAIVKQHAPDIPVPAATTMEDQIAGSIATERLMATLALFFGALALLITAIGLYGTLAYTTARRTGEIGIRMALGAGRREVLSLVLWENAGVALAGCLAGVAASLLASRYVAALLYGTSARSPAVLLSSVAALAAIAGLASLIPALRASRIDPLAAIRYE
jgi:predicted permease